MGEMKERAAAVMATKWFWIFVPAFATGMVLYDVPGMPTGVPYIAAKLSAVAGWLTWRWWDERREYQASVREAKRWRETHHS